MYVWWISLNIVFLPDTGDMIHLLCGQYQTIHNMATCIPKYPLISYVLSQ